MQKDIAKHLKGKSILILGYGREGKSALKFVRAYLPDAKVAVADAKELDLKDVESFSGDDYLKQCENFDVIIKSPGIPVKDNFSAENRAKITSCVDLFLQFCPNPIIGVTGTKGKSTTSSLIHHILKECGMDAILAGNIGLSVFDIMDDIRSNTIITLELSCHQLEFIHRSPNISILLNLYEEHLDHYNNAEEYYDAKKNIFRYQQFDDTLIYGDIFQHATEAEINEAVAGHKINIAKDIEIPDKQIQTYLLGEHNRYDIRAAIAACEAIGLKREEILKAVATFRGLPHRLEFIGEFQDIKFYNDSIATAQEAVMSALKAIPDTDTIILGGMDRGLNYEPLANFLRKTKLHNVILLPSTAERLLTLINEEPHHLILYVVHDMDEAVHTAYKVTEKGHSCLLSPAAASYGFYANFEKRGDDFRDKVHKYATLIKKA